MSSQLTLLLLAIACYYLVTKYVFDWVFETSTTVVDELFHLPQGIAYCNKNFTHWDNKITTFPGLYMVSAAFVSTNFTCNVYNLRCINLAASCANMMLFGSILHYIYGSSEGTLEQRVKISLQALNLALLPPLYFFSHIYYTDPLSLTFLLAYSRLCLENKRRFMMLCLGIMSIMMRQTNIVWIALVFGHKVIDIFIRSSRVFGNNYLNNITLSKNSSIKQDIDTSKLRRYYGLNDLYIAVKHHVRTCLRSFFNFITYWDIMTLTTHMSIMSGFLAFIVHNGSIVVGDKEAHKPTLHIPQMFYFLLFYGFFGLPYVLAKLSSTIQLILDNKIKAVLLTIAFLVAVHFNTIVHPYLLADNRHYTFYIWNRWFGKYSFAIYATVPLYIFLLFSLYDNLRLQNCISFLFPFTICSFIVLALQPMIEIRYFLIPYIILRLRFMRPSFDIIIFEFLWYVLINLLTFYQFFTKEIYWSDFTDAQRLIW